MSFILLKSLYTATIHTFLLLCATAAITLSLFKTQKLQKLTQGCVTQSTSGFVLAF
jgi:hypothetical protein